MVLFDNYLVVFVDLVEVRYYYPSFAGYFVLGNTDFIGRVSFI